jgi:hypothetical protein
MQPFPRRLVLASLTAAIGAFGAFGGLHAHAQTNLLSNGGFESAGGWTTHGSFNFTGLFGTYAHSGTHYAASSTAGCLCADLSTLVDTTPGQTYDISFWVIGGGTGHKELQVDWGNQVLLSLVDTNFANSYQQYSFTGLTVSATASQTLLKFWSRNDPTSNGIDDVSVTLHAAAVPEAGSARLLAAGLLALGGLKLRRQRPA